MHATYATLKSLLSNLKVNYMSEKKHGTLNTGIEGSKVVVFYETNLHGRGCMYTLTSRFCDV